MYSQTKQYIKNLRYILVVTQILVHRQRSWIVWNKTTNRPFKLYNGEQKSFTQQDLPKLEKYDTLVFRLWIYVIYICFLCTFTKWEVLLCISMLFINENKLNSASKIFPAKWLVFSHTTYFTVSSNPLRLSTLEPV